MRTRSVVICGYSQYYKGHNRDEFEIEGNIKTAFKRFFWKCYREHR